MNVASSSVDRAEAPVFADGLGERVVVADGTTGELLQILRLRPALTAVPSFEFALRERTARLMNFRHAYYARVRRVDRGQANGTLAVVSDHVEGTRLSEILRVAHQRGIQLDTNAALCLIRQLVPAVALLHENARDASHGLIAPERLVVTPHARLVIVEHVAGSAVEQLQFGRERLWQELRVALPASAGPARFDHRADVNGIGITALSLVLGRPLSADEFPHAIPQLLAQARERSPLGDERPLSAEFRNWLGRTLQLDVRRAFASAPEALAALEETLASDASYLPAPVALDTFLAQYSSAMLEAIDPPPAVVPALSMAPPPVAAGPQPLRVAAADDAPRQATPAPVPDAAPMPASAAGERPAAVVAPLKPVPPAAADASVLETTPSLADLIPVEDLRPAPVRQAAAAPPPQREPEALYQAFASDRHDDYQVHEAAGAAHGPAAGSHAGPPAKSRTRLIAAAVAVLAIGGGGYYASQMSAGAPATAAAPSLGTLIVQSNPAGVEVFIDGESRGMTPSSLSLPAGSHILELRGRGTPRVIPLQIPAGGQISQYLEFADTPLTGMLVVHSQPAGAKVTVDGVARGVSPITLDGLQPGDHTVVLENETGSSRHVVKVLAGTTASLVAPVAGGATEGPVSGWISVKVPFTVEIREDGKLLGTTETDRVMVAAGRHSLELVNQALGYREIRTVQVPPGKVADITIDLPKGVVNLNAAPWAEVWIDGRRVGDTPLGNLEVPIGPHEIVFRHPEFGEKRHAISVSAAAPVRLSVSMK